MNNTITIVIIVCITIVVLYAISAIDRALQRKEVNKQINKFSKAFPNNTIDSVNQNLKKINELKKDLPKFGDE